MRNVSILILMLMIVGCHQPNPYEGINNPPHTPAVIFPANDTTDINVDIHLQWNGGDPDAGDVVRYDVYLDTSNANPTIKGTSLTINSYHPDSLLFSTRYYWKVVARDQQGEEALSPVWSFVTRPKSNQPPNVPSNPTPADGSTSVNVQGQTLRWQGGDPDTCSVVYYDVYLDTISPPVKLVSAEQTSEQCQLSLLDYDQQYFWKIVARDNYGAETASPTWNFITKSAVSYFVESFDDYTTDEIPPDSTWIVYGDYGTVFVTDSVRFGASGKSCQFVDETMANATILAAKSLSTFPKTVGILEFAMRVDKETDFLGMRLYPEDVDNNNRGPQISIRGDSLQYYDRDWTWKLLAIANPKTWYQIRIVFDCMNPVNDDTSVFRAQLKTKLYQIKDKFKSNLIDCIRINELLGDFELNNISINQLKMLLLTNIKTSVTRHSGAIGTSWQEVDGIFVYSPFFQHVPDTAAFSGLADTLKKRLQQRQPLLNVPIYDYEKAGPHNIAISARATKEKKLQIIIKPTMTVNFAFENVPLTKSELGYVADFVVESIQAYLGGHVQNIPPAPISRFESVPSFLFAGASHFSIANQIQPLQPNNVRKWGYIYGGLELAALLIACNRDKQAVERTNNNNLIQRNIALGTAAGMAIISGIHALCNIKKHNERVMQR